VCEKEQKSGGVGDYGRGVKDIAGCRTERGEGNGIVGGLILEVCGSFYWVV